MSAPADTIGQPFEQETPVLRLTSPIVVAWNSFLNLCNEVWTLLVVFVTMPILIRGMGKDGFGLFSLAWVVLGYMAILDLGVSRAATKFVSEHLSRSQVGSVERVCRAALTSNLILGIAGSVAAWLTAPWLVEHVFKIPLSLQYQARITFYALALSIPVMLVQASIRAVLSSYQKFGWINTINASAITLQLGGACALTLLGLSIDRIVIACVIVRAIAMVGFAFGLARINPRLLQPGFAETGELWHLLKFGGWVSLSQIMTPVLLYLDRVLVVVLSSLAAMTVYVIPSEIVARLRIVPASLINSLFPSLSEHSAPSSIASRQHLYAESIKYILLLLLPCFLLLAIFGTDLISLWIGPEYAKPGGQVLRVLSAGGLLNALGFVPSAALVALGRPDIPAKFHVIEVPLYLLLSFALIPRWGILGAALAVSSRLIIDSCALFWAARRFVGCALAYQTPRRVIELNVGLACLFLLIHKWTNVPGGRLLAAAACLLGYCFAGWFIVLGERERPIISHILRMGGKVA